MDYSTFKALQALLFFGSAMGFCLWQLAVIRRMRREDAARLEQAKAADAPDVTRARVMRDTQG